MIDWFDDHFLLLDLYFEVYHISNIRYVHYVEVADF